MPQSTTISAPGGVWTQLTDADVTAITFQNMGPSAVRIEATAGATAPVGMAGSTAYDPGQGERNAALADLFPGITGANRVWVFVPHGAAANITLSHA